MAVLALLTSEDITQSMYDTLRKEVNWEHQHPQGAIMHVASFDDTGAHVADVWSSPAALDEFVNTRLLPAIQRLDFPIPDVAVYPAHNINAFTSVQQYVLK